MANRYYPKGYIGSEQAAVLLAQLRYPEHWRADTILPEEQEIWDALGVRLNAELIDCFIEDFIRKNKAKQKFDKSITLERLADFSCSIRDLRQALHAGDLTAEFCDERGRINLIRRDGWGTDDGFYILASGVGTLDGMTFVILLSEVAIEALARSLRAEDRRQELLAPKQSREASKSQAPKVASRPMGEIFQEWRIAFETEHGRLPTRDEDVEYMKTHGFNRDKVREIRKKFPSLSRGMRVSLVQRVKP